MKQACQASVLSLCKLNTKPVGYRASRIALSTFITLKLICSWFLVQKQMQISVFSHKFWHKHHVLEIASCSLKGRASQLTNSRLWQIGRPVRSAQKDGMERQACGHVTALLHASRSWCPDSFCLLNWPYPSLSLIFYRSHGVCQEGNFQNSFLKLIWCLGNC